MAYSFIGVRAWLFHSKTGSSWRKDLVEENYRNHDSQEAKEGNRVRKKGSWGQIQTSGHSSITHVDSSRSVIH